MILEPFNTFLIVKHDDPDSDAIASGRAIRSLIALHEIVKKWLANLTCLSCTQESRNAPLNRRASPISSNANCSQVTARQFLKRLRGVFRTKFAE